MEGALCTVRVPNGCALETSLYMYVHVHTLYMYISH